jgi:hypothetical protein
MNYKIRIETSLQEGYTLTDWETWLNQKYLSQDKGSSNILLLSHYDSAPHSFSLVQVMQDQVATILESVRFYMTIKNIKMILLFFFRCRRISLNGAALFVSINGQRILA